MKTIQTLVSLLIIVLILTSCASNEITAIEISPTVELASSLTPLPSQVFLTPLPTLTNDRAKELVRELLENNAGCRLPCWWGITPGKTTW